jgi:hypothetical protein
LIKRLLYSEIEPYFDHKNALVITGMRQVGKTTLARQIYETVNLPKIWFDFDNPLDQMVFEKTDYNAIYYQLKQSTGATDNSRMAVFIDEMQNLPVVTKVIKYLIDHYSVKFVVTGSSDFYLRNLFPESLSGRKFLFHLNPLRFREILYFRGVISREEAMQNNISGTLKIADKIVFEKRKPFYEEFIEFGGFPEVVTSDGNNLKKMVLKNIFASFFEKDIRLLSDFKDIRELRDLILMLVPRVGSQIDVTRFSGELGINRVKMYSYLEFLSGVFFLITIPRYGNIDKAVAGGKKLYFPDTGLLNILGKVNEGQLFENAVALQLADYGKISFYNKQNKSEIDFILDNEHAFEVKLTAQPADINKLQVLSNKLNINRFHVISRNYIDEQDFLYPVLI